VTETSNEKLRYPLEVAHKARHSLCVGLEDIRGRALVAVLEIANVPEDQLPSELKEEWRTILDLANGPEAPEILDKERGQEIAERIYEFCRAIEVRFNET
jgi:hypothetical protein